MSGIDCWFLAAWILITFAIDHGQVSTTASGTPAEFNESLICGGKVVMTGSRNNSDTRDAPLYYWHNTTNENHCFFELPDHLDVVTIVDMAEQEVASQQRLFNITAGRTHCGNYEATLPQIVNEEMHWGAFDATKKIRPRAQSLIPLGVRNWTWGSTTGTVIWDNGQKDEFNVTGLFKLRPGMPPTSAGQWKHYGDAEILYMEVHPVAGNVFWEAFDTERRGLLVLCHQNVTKLIASRASTSSNGDGSPETSPSGSEFPGSPISPTEPSDVPGKEPSGGVEQISVAVISQTVMVFISMAFVLREQW